jgi:hypothetical protein
VNFLEPASIDCPYCGEAIDIMVDISVPYQDYIEDCQVCCKPMEISVSVEDNEIVGLSVRSDSE